MQAGKRQLELRLESGDLGHAAVGGLGRGVPEQRGLADSRVTVDHERRAPPIADTGEQSVERVTLARIVPGEPAPPRPRVERYGNRGRRCRDVSRQDLRLSSSIKSVYGASASTSVRRCCVGSGADLTEAPRRVQSQEIRPVRVEELGERARRATRDPPEGAGRVVVLTRKYGPLGRVMSSSASPAGAPASMSCSSTSCSAANSKVTVSPNSAERTSRASCHDKATGPVRLWCAPHHARSVRTRRARSGAAHPGSRSIPSRRRTAPRLLQCRRPPARRPRTTSLPIWRVAPITAVIATSGGWEVAPWSRMRGWKRP